MERQPCKIKNQIFNSIPLPANQKWRNLKCEMKGLCSEGGFGACSWCPPPNGRVQDWCSFPRSDFGEGQDLSTGVMLLLGGDFAAKFWDSSKKKKNKPQLKEQTPNWELRLHGETIPRKKSVIGMDAFTNRQKYLFHSIFKVFKPHDLSFSGADSSAIVTLSESWACQEKSGDRTRPLLVTLEALQLQGLCWGHLSGRIYFG